MYSQSRKPRERSTCGPMRLPPISCWMPKTSRLWTEPSLRLAAQHRWPCCDRDRRIHKPEKLETAASAQPGWRRAYGSAAVSLRPAEGPGLWRIVISTVGETFVARASGCLHRESGASRSPSQRWPPSLELRGTDHGRPMEQLKRSGFKLNRSAKYPALPVGQRSFHRATRNSWMNTACRRNSYDLL